MIASLPKQCKRIKLFLGKENFFLTKNNKYQNLTHVDKIMKYTEDLNLPLIKLKIFFLL